MATDRTTASAIAEFVKHGMDLSAGRIKAAPDPFWQALRAAGTELWLDTGDIDEAAKAWSAEMTALTTNNTLLNREIQKGIYDSLVKEAAGIVRHLKPRQQVLEIAFILNARHGLRLVQRFGGMVSVELHTDLADDLKGIVAYGTRFHEICPTNFIVKVPLTATGLLGARALRDKGIRINFTLEFSARQNALVTTIARPNYCNVFLGRLGAYMIDNGLGDGKMVGEKATLAAQEIVAALGRRNKEPTRLIAASMRSGDQVGSLAGVDVFTMPVKVAMDGRASIDKSTVRSHRGESPAVALPSGTDAKEIGIDKFWAVSDEERELAVKLGEKPPATGAELEALAHEAGCGDMFARLGKEDLSHIAGDGKIPKHSRWAERIRSGELATDTLLNRAGLASFSADQAQFDRRIEGLLKA